MAKKTMRERMLEASKSDNAGFFGDGDYGKIRDYIDTGNILLNCMLSADPDKGFPSGKIIQFAGPESVGKTFVCLETVKAAQKAGYFIVYYDSEMANDAESIIERGLDPETLLYVPVATVEELTTSLINILDECDPKEKLMVVVDSLGNLSTKKELQDSTDGSDKRDMTRAQKLRALFRTCTIKAGIKNVPFAAVNHVYAAVGGYGDPTKVGGGGGSLYASSAIISMTKAQIKGKDNVSGDEAVVGARITAKNIKSRFSKEKMKIKLDLDFSEGLQRYSGLQEVMEVLNMLIPVKRSFAYNPTGIVPKECQGRKKEDKEAFEAWLLTLPTYSAKDLHPSNSVVWNDILKNGLRQKLIDLFSYQGDSTVLDLSGEGVSDDEE